MPGLSDAEIERVELLFSFRFPDDLRRLLQSSLPGGGNWPDWRHAETCRELVDWPISGIEFDIEHDAFWLPEFGVKPDLIADAKRVARAHLSQAPALIPVYGHRYTLCGVCRSASSPVLSVNQSDIIPYGFDLNDWLSIEFGDTPHHSELPAEVDLGIWERVMMCDR
ncbi:MAG: SMI1/KNR4 family protein [Planctomycetota bacterium]